MIFLIDTTACFALGKKQLFATKRVVDKLADKKIEKYGRIHKSNLERYSKRELNKVVGLNDRESYSIKSYLDGAYRKINKGDDYLSRYLRYNTDKSLRKLPRTELPTKPLVRRIVVENDGIERFLNKYTTGKTFTSKGLTSTSKQIPESKNKQLFGKPVNDEQTKVKFLVKPRKNTRSRYVENIASRYDSEAEQLFPSRTPFKTTKVRHTNNGITINIEEL
jgi:hypothetical protein